MQNNKWIIKGLTKLYIHVHVLLNWHIHVYSCQCKMTFWDKAKNTSTCIDENSWWCPIHDLWWNKLRTYCFGSITICRPQLQYTFKQMLGLPSRFHISMVFKTKMFKQSKFFFIKTILWIFCHCNRGNKIAREIRFTSLCSQKCIML